MARKAHTSVPERGVRNRPFAQEDEPVRLGVLTNPTAQHNHRFPVTHRRLARRLRCPADAIQTADRSEIEQAVRVLLSERRVNLFAINGGDGTIHGAINAMVRLYADDWAAGCRVPPVLLLLNGGTYNMASRAMGTKGDPERTVARFLERYGQTALNKVPVREIGLLEVHPEGRAPMLGMVFGSEVVANALDLCDRLGSGYIGLARLLTQGVAGFVLQTEFYRTHAALLRPRDSNVSLDGHGLNDVVGAVASTIDLMLARGLVWSLTIAPGTAGFHAKLVRAKTPGEVVRLLPHLLWELPHPMIATHPDARRLVTWGRFTVDGELYDHDGRVEVRVSPYRFRVVSGEI